MNITLNEAKCRFRQAKIKFYGFIFSRNGIQADPEKIAAVISLETPESCDAVRSFFGMANYVRRFIPGFADITAPLRELTKKDATFQWTVDCEASVNSIKELLANEPVLAYFNTNIPSQIIVVASPIGLAAILTQQYGDNDFRIIAFASKSLSITVVFPTRTRSSRSTLGMPVFSYLHLWETSDGAQRPQTINLHLQWHVTSQHQVGKMEPQTSSIQRNNQAYPGRNKSS